VDILNVLSIFALP